jgi:hypothetical protein
MGMGWLAGAELIAGAVALVAGFVLMRVFRLVPQPGVEEPTPTATRLTIIPVVILLVLVCGISLVLRGMGLI